MTASRGARRVRPVAAAALLTVSLLLSGCSAIGDLGGSDPEPSPSAAPSATTVEEIYDSQFTRDGTFQSHIKVDGLDFVFTLYPTKSTPRTNEWYPAGNKFFSFTFQAYDLDQRLRDPFATKRRVYLDRIKVASRTVLEGGARGTERPYELDAVARTITFDPEPVGLPRYGMLVTSPKGAFELRNQRIRATSPDTRGIELMFTATVWIQERAGGPSYYERQIRQRVPIAIFESDQPTEVAKIPINAN